jgi:hypothetical protein
MPTYGGAVLGVNPYYVGVRPGGWKSLLAHSVLWSKVFDHLGGQAPTPEGTGVLHEEDFGTSSRIVIRGRNHRLLEVLGTCPPRR